MKKPLVSIVAVVLDTLNETERFVSSIRDHTDVQYELILIDNASRRKDVQRYVKKSADKSYRFAKRVSLAHAWNKGVTLAKGKYVAVVNNDVVVPPKWFRPLEDVFKMRKRVGLVSPLTYWTLNHAMRCDRIKDLRTPFRIPRWRQGVWGEFLVMRSSTIKEIGFCEEYKIAAGEDLELLYQLHERNLVAYIQPRVFVFHQGGATSDKVFSGGERDVIWTKNWKLFLKRWAKRKDQILDRV